MQLTKLEQPPPSNLSAEEIAALWNKIEKDKMIQFKLKVDLGPEVMKIINSEQDSGQGEAAPSAEENVKKKEQEIKTNLKANINDAMLKDDRD